MPDTTPTQRTPVVPLSEETCRATISAQWLLERKEDAHARPFHFNNLHVDICGEKAFERIAGDIQRAAKSIDIICWGFDPAMELVRERDVWPRGDTWGGLLRAAARRQVQVRLLVWHDSVGSRLANNMPGYGSDAPFELRAAPSRGMAVALAPGEYRPPAEPTEPRDRREVFNANWYRDAVAGRIEDLALRTREGVHADVLASLQSEISRAGQGLGLSLDRTELWGLEYMATHHQKTILIDYEGERPCGYVMGLNSVTDYWDTMAHHFDDKRRGQGWEGNGAKDGPGLKPYQDYACRIEGEALVAVSRNFTEAWNKAKVASRGAGKNLERTHDLQNPPANLTRHLSHPRQTVQIVRTLPAAQGSDKTIARLYEQAMSFARHYIYIENQYFQHAGWVADLKRQRQAYVDGCRGFLSQDQMPKLHVMVVIPTPELAQMVPRTHEAVTELGHGTSMPNQDLAMRDEIKRHEAGQAAHLRDPLVVRAPMPLSPAAQAYKAASQGRDDETARNQLEGQLGMRTLVASLWSWDGTWSESKHPVLEQARTEKARYEAALAAYRADGEAGRAAHGGPPKRPKSLKAEVDKAYASRYREIYIHSKLMVIDDSMFTLGSANLNLRSFAVDSELNMASDDPVKAKDLRKRVWAQHTKELLDGGDATDQEVMWQTFNGWQREMTNNAEAQKSGDPLSCSLVSFFDKRTSGIRLS